MVGQIIADDIAFARIIFLMAGGTITGVKQRTDRRRVVMEMLQETLIETALLVGYSMGERGEKMLLDSREVIDLIAERAAKFEARWAVANGLSVTGIIGGTDADYMGEVERFAEELLASLRAEGMIGRA